MCTVFERAQRCRACPVRGCPSAAASAAISEQALMVCATSNDRQLVLSCWLHRRPPQAHGFVPKLIDCALAHLLTEEQAAQQASGKSMFTLGGTAGGLLGTQVRS